MAELKKTLIAAAALTAAVWGFYAYTAGLKSERDQLAAELAAVTRRSEALAREMELNRRALEDREAERRRLAGENAALAQALEEIYDHDEKAREWADALCPDGVLDCLLGQMPAGQGDRAAGGLSSGR